MATTAPPAIAPPPTLNQLFLAFTKIGLTSFGGGLSGWLLREFVQRRHWLTEDAFMYGLAIAQAFPGINVVNLAIWIGYQLRGGKGALLGALGIAVPPMFVAIALFVVFEQLSSHPPVQIGMAGVAAAAIGLSLNMGLRALYRSARRVVPALFALATFCAIFVFQIPLYIVAGVLTPLSIALAYRRIQGEKKA